MSKYIEIQPFVRDGAKEKNLVASGKPFVIADLYSRAPSRIIKIESIRQFIPEPVPDGSVELTRLNLTESHQDDVIIMQGDAERIRKELLKDGGDGLAGEVRALTAAVRDLWNLLRARMR